MKQPAEDHFTVFKREYDRLPDTMSEDRRVAWAERVADNPLLQAVFSPTGPVLNGRYWPEDYPDDRKPSQVAGR